MTGRRGFLIVFVAVLIAWICISTSNQMDVRATSVTPPRKPDYTAAAISACEAWTLKNSRMAVIGGFLDESSIIEKGLHLRKNHHMVEVSYRAGASGLLMVTECEYVVTANNAFLVSAKTGLHN